MRRSGLAAALLLGSLIFAATANAEYPKVDASIILTKTVGLGSGCATTNDITVPLGSTVTYCYQVQNTGNTNLMTHTLEDDQLGVIVGPNAVFDLEPGGVYQRMRTVGPISQQIINVATATAITNVVDDQWYAYDGMLVATSTARATVTVLENADEPCRDGIDNDGDGFIDCADSSCIGAPTCGAAAPLMGSWGMLLLALALLAGGTAALTARRRSA